MTNEENNQEAILQRIACEMIVKYNDWETVPSDEEIKNELQIAFDVNGIESDEQFLREFADYIFSNLQTPTRVGIQPSSSVVEIESLLVADEQRPSREITQVIATARLRNSIQNGGYRGPVSRVIGPETRAFLSSLGDDDGIEPKKDDRLDEKTVAGYRKGFKPNIPAAAVLKESAVVDEDEKKWFESGEQKESSLEKPEENKDNSSLPVIILGTGILFILILTLIALYQNWNMPTVQISNQNENSITVDLGSVEKIEVIPTVVQLPLRVIIPTGVTQIARKKFCNHPSNCPCKQPGGRHAKKENEPISKEL